MKLPAPFRKHGTKRPLQNRPDVLAGGLVEAARLLGGQPFVFSAPPAATKIELDKGNETIYY